MVSSLFTPALLGLGIGLIVILIIWTVVWKGFALWKAARLNQPIWFVLLLIINTLGILEILYIFIFSKPSANKKRRRK